VAEGQSGRGGGGARAEWSYATQLVSWFFMVMHFFHSLQAHLPLRLRFIALAIISFINHSALRASYKETNFSFPLQKPYFYGFDWFLIFCFPRTISFGLEKLSQI